MTKIKLWLNGCDDSTVMPMDVTEGELEFLRRLEKLSVDTSTYQCMPTIEVEKQDDPLYAHDETEEQGDE